MKGSINTGNFFSNFPFVLDISEKVRRSPAAFTVTVKVDECVLATEWERTQHAARQETLTGIF